MVYSVNTRDGSIKYKNEIQNDECSVPRSGKWTAEEEALANSLVEQFEQGSLLDCLEGTTLRCYLAKRLNCAPMRISKKFAGKCIGKHTFARKHNLKISIDDNKNIPCVSPSNISFLQSINNGNTLDCVDFDNNQGLNSISMDSTENLSQIQCPILDSNSSLLSFFNTDTTTTTTATTSTTTNTCTNTYTKALPENINKKRTYNTAFLCTPNTETNNTTTAPTKPNAITTAITTDSIDDNDNIGLDLDDFFPEELHSSNRSNSETLNFTFSSLLRRPTVPLSVPGPVVVARPEYLNRSLTPTTELPSGVVQLHDQKEEEGIQYKKLQEEVVEVNRREVGVFLHSYKDEKETQQVEVEVEGTTTAITTNIPPEQCILSNVSLYDTSPYTYTYNYNTPSTTTTANNRSNTTTMSMIQNDEWTEIFTLLA